MTLLRRSVPVLAIFALAAMTALAPLAACRGKPSQDGKKRVVLKGPPAYTPDEVSLFMELAFGTDKTSPLRRFEGPVRLSTSGKLIPIDLHIIGETVGELNQLLGGEKVILTGENPNLILRVVPVAELDKLPASPGDEAGVRDKVDIGPDGVVKGGELLIDAGRPDAWRRRHIRSLILRALGLRHRTKRDLQSLFADPPGPGFGRLHEPDARVIKMLFDKGLKAGMPQAAVRQALTDARLTAEEVEAQKQQAAEQQKPTPAADAGGADAT